MLKLLTKSLEETNIVPQRLDQYRTRFAHFPNYAPQTINLLYLFGCLEFLPLFLVLNFLLPQQKLLSLKLLLLLLLQFYDPGVHFIEDQSQLRVSLIDQIGKVCLRFVIDAFEEQNRFKIILELSQVTVRKLLFYNGQNVLSVLALHIFSQLHNLLLYLEKCWNLFPGLIELLNNFVRDLC